jgi:hypothetical protein
VTIPSRLYVHAPTYNIHHTTYNIQHTTYNIQHTTYNIQHTTYNIQHTTYTYNIQQSTPVCVARVFVCRASNDPGFPFLVSNRRRAHGWSRLTYMQRRCAYGWRG